MSRHLALQLPGRISYLQPVFCRFGKIVGYSPGKNRLVAQHCVFKMRLKIQPALGKSFRFGKDHPSSSSTWEWAPLLGCPWSWKISGKASFMDSISGVARVMNSDTDEVNSRTRSDMLACIVNSRYATLSCKMYMSHRPPQARIYLWPGPVFIFHEIYFWYG